MSRLTDPIESLRFQVDEIKDKSVVTNNLLNEDKSNNGAFAFLPAELKQEILSYLGLKDRIYFSLSNRHFLEYVNHKAEHERFIQEKLAAESRQYFSELLPDLYIFDSQYKEEYVVLYKPIKELRELLQQQRRFYSEDKIPGLIIKAFNNPTKYNIESLYDESRLLKAEPLSYEKPLKFLAFYLLTVITKIMLITLSSMLYTYGLMFLISGLISAVALTPAGQALIGGALLLLAGIALSSLTFVATAKIFTYLFEKKETKASQMVGNLAYMLEIKHNVKVARSFFSKISLMEYVLLVLFFFSSPIGPVFFIGALCAFFADKVLIPKTKKIINSISQLTFFNNKRARSNLSDQVTEDSSEANFVYSQGAA